VASYREWQFETTPDVVKEVRESFARGRALELGGPDAGTPRRA
jgi:hypothetical protein